MEVLYKGFLARSLAIATFLMMLAISPGWAQIRFDLVGGANFSSLQEH